MKHRDRDSWGRWRNCRCDCGCQNCARLKYCDCMDNAHPHPHPRTSIFSFKNVIGITSVLFFVAIIINPILPSNGQGFQFSYPSFTIPMSLPPRGMYHAGFLYPSSSGPHPPPPPHPPRPTNGPPLYNTLMSHMGVGRRLSLPSMSRVSETLGALGTLARRFLRGSGIEAESKSEDEYQPTTPIITGSHLLPSASSTSTHRVNVSSPFFKIRPEDDPELNQALYTLSRNVLGPNVTNSLVPIVKTVNHMGRFLPPLIYRDGRIILGSGNATKDGGSIKDAVCTTTRGNPGKCLDISGCPSLLLDLQQLRKSLCFKALFIPGVCCADDPDGETAVVINPTPSTTTYRPISSHDPSRPPSTGSTIPNPDASNGKSDQCGRPEVPSFRIVGGEKSTPGNWPWMAAIFLHGPKGTEFWCGGTLISKKYILTAAHCTKDQKQKSFSPRQFTVRLGDYDLMKTDDPSSPESFRVVKIKAHESFNGVGFYNDVALLELDRDVDYSRYISPICLPQGRSRLNSFVGTYPTVIGWGTNKYGGREHTALQEVKLPVWTNAECDRSYFQPITEIFLCAGYPAGGRDACQGDSGGPLMLEMDGRWTQIGIVSFGNRCAEPNYPGVYTRLTHFMEWIKSNAI